MITKKAIKDALKGYTTKRTKEEIIEEIQLNIKAYIKHPDAYILCFASISWLLWCSGMEKDHARLIATNLLNEVAEKGSK